MVVFSTPTKSGRGLAIISDTSDKGNRSPSHYLFVFLDCLSTATTPLIFLFDSSRFHLIATSPPLLSLLPSYFLVFCCPSSPPPSLSCLLIACPSLAFFESWLHSLSPLKLHLYSAPPLLSPLISYRSLSFSLSVWASWQAVWGCAVLGQLSMAKLQ